MYQNFEIEKHLQFKLTFAKIIQKQNRNLRKIRFCENAQILAMHDQLLAGRPVIGTRYQV